MGATKAATAARQQLDTVMTTVVIPRVQQATTYLKTYSSDKAERRRHREEKENDHVNAQDRDGDDDAATTTKKKKNETRERVRGFENEYCSLDAMETGSECQV